MSDFQPRIIAFLCTWCSYAGADRAGAAHQSLPPGLQVVRVPCSGRVEPAFIVEALSNGADGVLTLACHPGDCHYREGNCRALQRHILLKRLAGQLGMDACRIRFEHVSATEGDVFSQIVNEMHTALCRICRVQSDAEPDRLQLTEDDYGSAPA